MKCKLKLYTSALMLALPVIVLVFVGSVDAQYFGRGRNRGYFTGTFDSSGTYVFPQGSPDGRANASVTRSCGGTKGNGGLAVTSAGGFIGTIRSRIGSTNAQTRTGAAFIVNTMLGFNGSSANRNPGSGDVDGNGEPDFAQWERLIREYDAEGLIQFNVCTNFPDGFDNSYYQGTRRGANPNDDAFYDQNGGEDQLAIIVRDPDNRSRILFQIKQNCGNPAGVLNPLKEINKEPVGSFTTIGGDTCRIQGWALDEDYAGSIRIAVRVGSRSGPAVFNGQANRFAPDPPSRYIPPYRNNGFRVNLPNSYKDGRTYRIFMNMVDVDSNGNSNGNFPTLPSQTIRCAPSRWNYVPNINGTASSLSTRRVESNPNSGSQYRAVYAGDDDGNPYIRVRANVRNTGNHDPSSARHAVLLRLVSTQNPLVSGNTEPSGDHRSRQNYVTVRRGAAGTRSGSTSGSGHYIVWGNQSGLATSGSRNYQAEFALNTDRIPHGDRLCFEAGISNHEGEAPNRITASGYEWSSIRCWTFLQSYDIDNGGVTINSTEAAPGQTIEVSYDTVNNGLGRSRERISGSPSRRAAVIAELETTGLNCEGRPSTLDSRRLNLAAGASFTSPTIDCVVPASASVGQQICFVAQFTNVEGLHDGYITNSGTRSSSQVCATVTSGPYFGVDRGSVFAGLVIGEDDLSASIPPVTTPTTPIIASSESTTSGDWVGGVTEFAALALGQISGFSSAIAVNDIADTTDSNPGTNAANAPRTALTFANSPGGTSGDFGGNHYELTDLYQLYDENFNDSLTEHRTLSGAVPNANSFTGGGGGSFRILEYDGDLDRLGNAGGIDLTGTDFDVVLFVNGDVRIRENITVFSGNYSSIDDIPSFTLIADGDINVSSNVTRIEGTYIAYGDFNSCNNSLSSQSPDELSTNNCDDQLVVDGLAAANRFLLKRTFGSTTGANSNGDTDPAEIFATAPEVYLSPPPNPVPDLPGVSSLVDLPPLF